MNEEHPIEGRRGGGRERKGREGGRWFQEGGGRSCLPAATISGPAPLPQAAAALPDLPSLQMQPRPRPPREEKAAKPPLSQHALQSRYNPTRFSGGGWGRGRGKKKRAPWRMRPVRDSPYGFRSAKKKKNHPTIIDRSNSRKEPPEEKDGATTRKRSRPSWERHLEVSPVWEGHRG